MSFKLLFPAAAVAVLLTGCAATPFEMRQATYDPDVSRAQNLLRVSSQGTKWDIPDTDAPEGFKGGSDGSVLLSAFGWAGNFRSAAGSGFLPGTTNWGLGLGVGLGLSLLTEFPAGSPGLEPREECGLSKFFNLGPNAAKPCT